MTWSADGESKSSFSSGSTRNLSIAELMHYDMKGESLRPALDPSSDANSDKDFVIASLTESLQIHKEIMERLHAERTAVLNDIERERNEALQATLKEKERALKLMEEQIQEYQRLESAYQLVVAELESKKEEYKRMEGSFYDHVRSIRPTDDDLSTIQVEITHLTSQLNNFCLGLRSRMDRTGGTDFVLTRWVDREKDIRAQFMASDDATERLEPGVLTMFTEKYAMEMLRTHIFDVPIHAGVSINKAFRILSAWIEERNTDWSSRLRQQVSALVVRQPGGEQVNIDKALEQLIDLMMDDLAQIYPRIKDTPSQRKKVENIVARAARLNLAMKGQEIKVFCASVEEGVALFDATIMRPTNRGATEGVVLFVISPPFIALDQKDEENGFVIPGKVFCADIK
ncbi:hypothetical protein BX666DRAFT_687696 [Dichotomocladium elegans]|nr:hypothetical protein BX666DRAFT_687696 [Dichotomocladium elegans]